MLMNEEKKLIHRPRCQLLWELILRAEVYDPGLWRQLGDVLESWAGRLLVEDFIIIFLGTLCCSLGLNTMDILSCA